MLAMMDRSTGRSGRVKFPTAPVWSGHENPDRSISDITAIGTVQTLCNEKLPKMIHPSLHQF